MTEIWPATARAHLKAECYQLITYVRICRTICMSPSRRWKIETHSSQFLKGGVKSPCPELLHPSAFLPLSGGGHTSLLHTKSKKMAPGYLNITLWRRSRHQGLYPLDPPAKISDTCPNIVLIFWYPYVPIPTYKSMPCPADRYQGASHFLLWRTKIAGHAPRYLLNLLWRTKNGTWVCP